MPYIGNDLATQFQAFATQTITGDGSTSYTLDRAVANGKELLVYINNVKQEEGSGKSYTASGTTITFSEAVASTDSCYVVFLGSAIQTVTAPDASIVSGQFANSALTLPNTLTVTDGLTVSGSTPTLTMGDAGAEDTKIVFDGNAQDFHIGLDDSTDSLTIGLGSALGTTSHVVIDANGVVTAPNIPCFSVTAGSQSWSGSNNEQVIEFDSEDVDNGGHFNTSNYRFTAPVAGHYFFTIHAHMNGFSTDVAGGPGVFLRKNGSSSTTLFMYIYYTGYKGSSVQGIINLAKDDYVTGAAINYNSTSFTLGGLRMSGFLLG